MVNISTVRSVAILIRICAESWKRLPAYFAELSPKAPTPAQQAAPTVSGPGGNDSSRAKPYTQQSASSQGGQGGTKFLSSTGNCGLADFFANLEEATYQVFQASYKEVTDRDGKELVQLFFMACPSNEINWEKPRPFEDWQKACRAACGLAGFSVEGYCNPFSEGRKLLPGIHALSINAAAPSEDSDRWLVDEEGQPLEGKKPSGRLVIKDGIVKLA